MNQTNSKITFEQVKQRIELLSKGITPPLFKGKPLRGFASEGVGAGPQGKTFHILQSDKSSSGSMISVPVYNHNHILAKYSLKSELGNDGNLYIENGMTLKSVSIPNFLTMKLSDGSPLPKNGMIMKHCYNTLTSVMGYECIHFRNNEPCRYCEIGSVGEGIRGFPSRQEIASFIEAVEKAVQSDPIRSMTITAGTFSENRNDVLIQYIELLKELKNRVTIDVHIQYEPVTNENLVEEAAKYASSAGIFIEILDESIRAKICPGKSKIPRSDYIDNFKTAVKHFGKGNVMTTCLIGFGESFESTLSSIEEFSELGVKTGIIFVRPNNTFLSDYVPTYLEKSIDELLDLFIRAGQIMSKNGVSFGIGKGAGCVGCQGCTVMNEVCALAS